MHLSNRLKTGANEAMEGARSAAKVARETAEEARDKHGDKVADGVAKAGRFVDDRTGGRFHQRIDQGVSKVRDVLHKPDQPEPDIDAAVDVEPEHSEEDDTPNR